jgi:hypothetical protein
MYLAKPLIPFWDDDDIHLRVRTESESDDAGDEVEDFTLKWDSEEATMGYTLIPAMCGEKVPSKQDVTARFDEDGMCGDCLEAAKENGISLNEYTY